MKKDLKTKRPLSDFAIEELKQSFSKSHDFKNLAYSNRKTGIHFSFIFLPH
ncbi:hypothetical protein NCCP133_26890 [Cytobacillus sp. NCCP-133]|nr:hypothetical protein NCCP133_26890 [Cytobacillus sp. NCCP-133]